MRTRLMMVITLDGVIARNSHQNPTEWSSKEDQKLFQEITRDWQVLIMGKHTYDAIGQPLPQRLNIVLTSAKRPDTPGLLEHWSAGIEDLLTNLKKRGYKKVIIAGGTDVNSQFLKNNLIDEIQLTIEPKIFGRGLRLFDQFEVDVNLKLLEIKKLNSNTLNLIYQVIK